MHKVAKTLNRHWQGIASAISRKVTNACTEGINSKIEKIKRGAYGFRSRISLRTAILFHCGGLDLYPKPARS
jgi:transposase